MPDKSATSGPVSFAPLTRADAVIRLQNLLADDGSRFAVIVIDLDNFRNVNDALGYGIGDALLNSALVRIQSVMQASAMSERLSGDEFLVVLNHVDSLRQLHDDAELIGEVIRFPIDLDDGRRVLTASLGISLFPDDGKDAVSLLRNAEIAMYSAKAKGKNRHCLFQSKLYETIRGRLTLETDLVEALSVDQFLLYYEPRITLATGKLSGMEALVRWRHPQRGLVPPMEFIPLAEENGLINRLGRIVLEHAIRQAAIWFHAGLLQVPISVNLSAHQLEDEGLGAMIEATLTRHGLPPAMIDLELTESAAVSGDVISALKQLTVLRNIGFRLLIDDFGTGYSSLGQLQDLRPDVLKIDKSFTAKLDTSDKGKTFIAAIISMSHALGMPVIAEGVETAAQLQHLRDLSCDEIQGYFLARPMPTAAMTALLGNPVFECLREA